MIYRKEHILIVVKRTIIVQTQSSRVFRINSQNRGGENAISDNKSDFECSLLKLQYR